MKIYNKTEYDKLPLYFWSNSACELFNPHERLADGQWKELDSEKELPAELERIFNTVYREVGAGRAHLTELDGKYGIVFECEYYELKEDGSPGEVNNFDRAVEVALKAEEAFPLTTVFVGKSCGGDWFVKGDFATLLNIFIECKDASEEMLERIEAWIADNAWIF